MAVWQRYEIEGRRWLSIARAAKLLGTNAQGVRKLMGSGALDWCQSRANSTRLVVDEAGVMKLRAERPPARSRKHPAPKRERDRPWPERRTRGGLWEAHHLRLTLPKRDDEEAGK